MAVVIVRLHARAEQYGAIPSNIPGSARAHIGQKPTNPLNSVIAPSPTNTHSVRVAPLRRHAKHHQADADQAAAPAFPPG